MPIYSNDLLKTVNQTDDYWLKKAQESELDGFIGVNESQQFLDNLLNVPD